MKLNLKPRELRLPGGIVLMARPLETWAYQRWLDYGLRELAQGKTQSAEEQVRRAATSAEGHELAGEILTAHVLQVSGLEVQDEQGTRPGTVQDLLGQGLLAPYVLRAMNALMQASLLTEADVGNSSAPPPAPSAAP